MTVEELLTRLDKVRPRGMNEWQARRLRLCLVVWLIQQERRHLEKKLKRGWDAQLSLELDRLLAAEELLPVNDLDKSEGPSYVA